MDHKTQILTGAFGLLAEAVARSMLDDSIVVDADEQHQLEIAFWTKVNQFKEPEILPEPKAKPWRQEQRSETQFRPGDHKPGVWSR
jgi:hypothetical protein